MRRVERYFSAMHVSSTSSGPSVELRVNYKRLNTFFADYVKSISRGGTFISTQRPLSPGTSFVFVLGVPKLEAPLVVGGKVTSVTSAEAASAESPAGMEVQLEYESELERETIRTTVESLMHQELGQPLASALLRSH